MIKSTISVFYNGISGVAKATRLVNHITDLQNFMGDVVKTASQPECCEWGNGRLGLVLLVVKPDSITNS